MSSCGVHDTERRVTLQQIHCVETRFAPHIHEVPEVPTHQIRDAVSRADGHVQGIIGKLLAHHTRPQIFLRQVFRLFRRHQ